MASEEWNQWKRAGPGWSSGLVFLQSGRNYPPRINPLLDYGELQKRLLQKAASE